jgi:hypothetical protein
VNARVVVVAMFVASASAAADVRIVRDGACALDRLPMRIAELVGEPVASGTIRVRTARNGQVRAEITVLGAAAEPRTITAPDCDALVDPIAVVVGLLIRTLPTEPTIDLPLSITSQPAVVLPPLHEHTASTVRVLELGGGATFEGEPVISVGGRLGRGFTTLGAELAVLPPGDRSTEMGNVRISSGRLTVAPCVEKWAIAGCALLSAGWVHGSRDGMGAHSATLPTTAAGARVEWRPSVGPQLGVRVYAETRYFVNRVAFLVDDAPVWRSPSTETLVGIGGFVRFP